VHQRAIIGDAATAAKTTRRAVPSAKAALTQRGISAYVDVTQRSIIADELGHPTARIHCRNSVRHMRRDCPIRRRVRPLSQPCAEASGRRRDEGGVPSPCFPRGGNNDWWCGAGRDPRGHLVSSQWSAVRPCWARSRGSFPRCVGLCAPSCSPSPSRAAMSGVSVAHAESHPSPGRLPVGHRVGVGSANVRRDSCLLRTPGRCCRPESSTSHSARRDGLRLRARRSHRGCGVLLVTGRTGCLSHQCGCVRTSDARAADNTDSNVRRGYCGGRGSESEMTMGSFTGARRGYRE
jgi:hypothetical protein